MTNAQKRYAIQPFLLPRWQKRMVMLSVDVLLLCLAVWLSFALRLGDWLPDMKEGEWLLLVAPIVTLPVFTAFGLYRTIIRHASNHTVFAILQGITLSTLLLAASGALFNWEGIPRSVYPIYWGVAFLLIGGSRYLARHYYQRLQQKTIRTPVIIYGAGQSGAQLGVALNALHQYRIVAYIDDNQRLQNASINGIKVFDRKHLPELIETHQVKQVLLAMPSATSTERQAILHYLEPLDVHVRTIPSLADLVAGHNTISELRDIDIDDLLGRLPVAPNEYLLGTCITRKVVMVTGAGGSIGSELCRQIMYLQPTCLVLFELSEFALYQIEQELLELKQQNHLNTPIIPVLGSVQDRQRLETTMRRYQVNTLYHAAAYKHVPMVEHNPVEGIRNNVFGTWHTAEAAMNANVERFILISTDKAVRPTNIMGASKRMAELVLQGLAQLPSNTTFGMVRFGNVLGSSGSVVPLFRKQIQAGGPLTVTHPDIIRYFMTIPEAAQLVIQAGAMAEGGDVFLLDMGEPVRILDMAKRMIRLSGLEVQDDDHPHGDIRIEFTGLRPGEKLYEELLIGSVSEATQHARIFKAHEQAIPWEECRQQLLNKLELACQQEDLASIQRICKRYVQGFKHNANTPAAASTTTASLAICA